ncbi:TetR/AcrR family transcriptional regulator [Gordonia sp. LSe1-13]|uniref:TetR/AcrR family transcriptional regulator n=1 Tax=Gordonia sesuvii TaxID=3116777 RepID=A0ABU7MGS9_9ACTN|nr:TetR/AcrR family transcriptional regulator [Gordonia sp. LSe1-13]
MTTASAEDRRVRPKDRKQRILATAAELFRTSGYHSVSMSDIAAGVGIVPSALYRHYRNKQELLVAVFDNALSRYEETLADCDDPFECVSRVVGIADDSQAMDQLWSRDRGHLRPADRALLRLRIVGVSESLEKAIAQGAGPAGVPSRVAAWAVLAIVNWPGHRPLPVPAGDRQRMMLTAVRAVVNACRGDGEESHPWPANGTVDESSPVPTEPATGLLPVARREALLNAAITMFAVNGYANVSLDDIGEVVGIAGPSVYNHFASKRELLVCGVNRAFDAMWLELGRVLSQTTDPAIALDMLVSGYARFAQAHWDLIAVCLSHTVMLDPDEMMALARTYLDYVGEWRRLVQLCRPELRADEAQTLVDLTLAVMDGVVRVDGLRGPELPHHAHRLAKAVLQAPLVT